jgi:hypothetical protein
VTARIGHLAEKLAEPHDDVEWEEGDHGGFCWKTLAICIAIVVVAFCAAEALL